MRSNVHPSFPNGDNCSRILFNSDLLRLTYALTPLPLFPPLLRLSLGTAFNFELVNHVFKGLTSILNAGDIEAEVSDDDTNPYAAFFDITALRSIAELLEKMQQCPTNELNAWRHNNPGQVCSSIAFILFVVFFLCCIFRCPVQHAINRLLGRWKPNHVCACGRLVHSSPRFFSSASSCFHILAQRGGSGEAAADQGEGGGRHPQGRRPACKPALHPHCPASGAVCRFIVVVDIGCVW